MKKISMVVMTVAILVSTLWFSTNQAGAAGIITYQGGVFVSGKGVTFVFDASGYRNKDVKNASIFVGSNFHDLHCRLNKEKNKIICVAGGSLTQYAGQTGIIYLVGQRFYVIIPGLSLSSAVTCGSGEAWGATVTFDAAEGDPQSYFLSGQNLGEVGNSANDLMEAADGFLSNPQLSGLDCGVPTFPEFLK